MLAELWAEGEVEPGGALETGDAQDELAGRGGGRCQVASGMVWAAGMNGVAGRDAVWRWRPWRTSRLEGGSEPGWVVVV